MARRLRLTLASVLAVCALGAIAPAANAYIYWSSPDFSIIGRANLNGTISDRSLIEGTDYPGAIAVDGNHFYWADQFTNSIGRTNLNGTGVEHSFITGATNPYGLAVDGNHIYWANSGTDTIGRANLDGSSPDQSFITETSGPRGIVVAGNHIYWANSGTNSIGRANLDGSSASQSFVTGASSPFGVAVDGNHIYWGNIDSNTVGRATLNGDGAASSVEQSFITGPSGSRVWGVAVHGNYVYWANFDTNAIGRAKLDGTRINQSFITRVSEPQGVVVDSLSDPTVAGVGKPTKRSLTVKVGCGDASACSLRLTGKKVGTKAAIKPKTVSVRAGGKKTVNLTYTRALKTTLAEGGRVRVTATDPETGGVKSIKVRVAR